MSHQATAWLLWFSESRLADRLVLNVVAYHAANDTGDAWPSIATIVEESALSERQVYDSIKVLCAMGELFVRDEPSDRGTNCYHMPKFFEWLKQVHPAKSAGGAKSAGCKPRIMQVQDVQNAGAKSADESSLETSLETSLESTPAICTLCGAEGIHKCPGHLNEKQRAKRQGGKSTPNFARYNPFSAPRPEPRPHINYAALRLEEEIAADALREKLENERFQRAADRVSAKMGGAVRKKNP